MIINLEIELLFRDFFYFSTMKVLDQKEFKVNEEMLASKSKRFLNLVIDRIVFYLVLIVIGVLAALIADILGNENILQFIEGLDNVNAIVDRLVSTAILLIFYMILEGLTQRTIGKLITKTKVVLENGKKPPLETIIIRSLCRAIPFNAFSFLGSSNRGWHDSISKTFVVDTQKFEEHKKAHQDFLQIGITHQN